MSLWPRRAVLGSLFLAACQTAAAHGADKRDPPPTTSAPADATDVTDAGAPLLGHEWMEAVGDDAHEVGKVTVPIGATSRRPVVVALHGARDRADWACGEWRVILHGFPFVVCPRGDRSGSFYDAPAKTQADLQLAIAEVRNRFDGWVEPHDPEVLAGFSMGAAQALALVLGTELRASSLALVEGGYDTLATKGVAETLRSRGVTRVLLACTTNGACPTRYQAAARALSHAGIETRYVQAARKVHGVYPEVVEALAAEMPWLTAGRAGFVQ